MRHKIKQLIDDFTAKPTKELPSDNGVERLNDAQYESVVNLVEAWDKLTVEEIQSMSGYHPIALAGALHDMCDRGILLKCGSYYTLG